MVLKWPVLNTIKMDVFLYQPFRADIDYALVEAHTTYGRLGVKVWIMKGEVYGKRELSPLVGLSKKQGKGGAGGRGGNRDNKPRRRK